METTEALMKNGEDICTLMQDACCIISKSTEVPLVVLESAPELLVDIPEFLVNEAERKIEEKKLFGSNTIYP